MMHVKYGHTPGVGTQDNLYGGWGEWGMGTQLCFGWVCRRLQFSKFGPIFLKKCNKKRYPFVKRPIVSTLF